MHQIERWQVSSILVNTSTKLLGMHAFTLKLTSSYVLLTNTKKVFFFFKQLLFYHFKKMTLSTHKHPLFSSLKGKLINLSIFWLNWREQPITFKYHLH